VNSRVESHTKPVQVLVPRVFGTGGENFKSGFEVTVDPFGRGGLGLIRCGSEVGHSPLKT